MDNNIQPQGNNPTGEQQTMTFGQFLKTYIQRSFAVLKQPKQLIPTIVLGVLWIALSVAASMVKLWLPFEVLSFLTFAQGGMYGGIIGAVGGIVGKVVVATFLNDMIVPLFTGKKPFSSMGSGAKGMYSSLKMKSMAAVAPLLTAIGVALLLYSFMNINQMRHNAMVGIVAILMLVKNLGTRGGFAWDFLLSAAGAMSGRKMPDMQTINRILTGLVLGFTLAVTLSLTGLHWCVWVGIPFTIAGIVFSIVGRNKETNTRTPINNPLT